MTTEQKIKEAFEQFRVTDTSDRSNFTDFRAGYLALLNSLNTLATYTDKNGVKHNISFTLPEGVTKP